MYERRRRLVRPDSLVRTFSYALVVIVFAFVALGIFIVRADYPRLRIAHLAFRFLLPLGQRLLGLHHAVDSGRFHGFAFENPGGLEPLRRTYDLDAVVAAGATDFERWVLLMHWTRDRFPHYPNPHAPSANAFDGLALLESYRGEGGYLCGTIAPLFVQAVTALGGYARRVELRFTPGDSHVVVEVWSEHYGKWVVLDPDYDIFFSVDGVPQHAIELHQRWASDQIDTVRVHWRESPHNLYRPDLENGDRRFLRLIYSTRDWLRWDRERGQHKGERFAVRLLHYYTQVSFPLRNDWRSRPLRWWHPDGNHVQGSLVIALPTMPHWEDFLEHMPSPEPFYRSPMSR